MSPILELVAKPTPPEVLRVARILDRLFVAEDPRSGVAPMAQFDVEQTAPLPNDGDLWVWRADGQVVGYAAFQQAGWRQRLAVGPIARLIRVFILPPYRRQGLLTAAIPAWVRRYTLIVPEQPNAALSACWAKVQRSRSQVTQNSRYGGSG